nr:hypothetical protein [Melioribacteraceae bacterium]
LFDYSGDKIIDYFANIGEEIKRTKKFSFEYLSKLLLHATSFNANFIIRPKWSLMQFVFENESESTKQIVEVKQILNYLYYYPYLKRLLVNFFNKKRMISISNSELKELLNKIDKINFESNFDKVLDSALTSMAEFIYMGEVKNKKVSKQFVELFLADKGLSHFVTVLAENFSGSGVDKYEISKLKEIILEYNSTENSTDNELSSEQEESENVLSEAEEELNENNTEFLEEKVITEEETIEDEGSLEDSDVVKDEINENLDDVNVQDEKEEKKSFIESHIENLDNDVTSVEDSIIESTDEVENIEPPELDEEPRIDENNIDEIYELVTEEEKIDVVVEDEETVLSRVEIDDNENPFEEIDKDKDKDEAESNETEDIAKEENLETGYVVQGSSITFSSDELSSEVKTDPQDLITEESVENEIEEWPSESSMGKEENVENSNLDIEDVQENIGVEIASEETDKNINEVEATKIDNQQMLFSEEDLENISNIEDNTGEVDAESSKEIEQTKEILEQQIDISMLLENKKITKIIEVVFDYDMEEFANAIDKISECRNETEAHSAIDDVARKSYIDKSVKEIKVFKNIISEFFN